jgi:hypothetical protein
LADIDVDEKIQLHCLKEMGCKGVDSHNRAQDNFLWLALFDFLKGEKLLDYLSVLLRPAFSTGLVS